MNVHRCQCVLDCNMMIYVLLVFARSHVVLLQMPQRISSIAVTAAQRNPVSVATMAAISALNKLFEVAAINTASSSTLSLRLAMWQQVDSTGLLENLPALLTAATQELAAHTRDSNTASSDAATGSTGGSTISQHGLSFYVIHMTHLFQVVNHLQSPAFDKAQRVSAALALGPATMEAVVQAVTCVDRLQQQKQQESDMDLGDLCRLTSTTLAAATDTFNALADSQQGGDSGVWCATPDAAPLLRSPNLLRCVALLAAVGVYAAAAGPCQEPQQGGASGSGSSSSTRATTNTGPLSAGSPTASSTSTSLTSMEELVLAALEQVPANHRYVTACQHRLCELLGLSSSTVVYLSLFLRRSITIGSELWQIPAASPSKLVEAAATVYAQMLSPQAARQYQIEQEQREVHMLLSSLWLQFAAQRVQVPEFGGLLGVVRGASACCTSLMTWGQPPPADLLSELLPPALNTLRCVLEQQPQQQDDGVQKQAQGMAVVTLVTALSKLLRDVLKADVPAASTWPAWLPRASAPPEPSATTTAAAACQQVVVDSMPDLLAVLEATVRYFARCGASGLAPLSATASATTASVSDSQVRRGMDTFVRLLELVVKLLVSRQYPQHPSSGSP